jgi:hypothetical protein
VSKEELQEILSTQLVVASHFEEDVGECTYAERIVPGDRDVMLAAPERD